MMAQSSNVALRRLRQWDCFEIKASLGYIVSYKLAWAIV